LLRVGGEGGGREVLDLHREGCRQPRLRKLTEKLNFNSLGDRFRGSRELIVSLLVFSSYTHTKQETTSPFPEKSQTQTLTITITITITITKTITITQTITRTRTRTITRTRTRTITITRTRTLHNFFFTLWS
jgi:hypothetical protein